MLSELEITEPERAAEIRRKYQERKQKREEEEKEDQLFILPQKTKKN